MQFTKSLAQAKSHTNNALVTTTSHKGKYLTEGFWDTSLSLAKMPLSFDILFSRIESLAREYDLKPILNTYRINSEGVKAAKKENVDTGGVYIWYCHVTGRFYVGSCILFFGPRGRISFYLAPSTIKSGKGVNKNLAKDILAYGFAAFSLIIVESFPVDEVGYKQIRTQEQLWIILYPTYNATLAV